MTVEVNRVVVDGAQIGEPDAHAVAASGDERLGCWKCFGVEGQRVEAGKNSRIWPVCSWLDVPFAQQDREIAVRRWLGRAARMDDE